MRGHVAQLYCRMPPQRVTRSETSISPVNSLHTAKPFRRQAVEGVGVKVMVELAEPNDLGWHRHSAWQVVMVPPGGAVEARWKTPAGRQTNRRLVGGDIWVLPSNWFQAGRWREQIELIVFYLNDGWVKRFFPALRTESSIAPLTEYVAANPRIAELSRDLRIFAQLPNGATDWQVAAIGSHLAALILPAHLLLVDGVFRPPSALVEKVFRKLRQHLMERRNERIPLARMARGFGVSDRHLRRIFRNATGVSPQEWLLRERAKHAADLLLTGESVKGTVERSGFASQAHLYRVMFRVYGVSPTAFRKNAQASAASFSGITPSAPNGGQDAAR